MDYECDKCGGEIEFHESEPDIGISGGYQCEDCGKNFDESDVVGIDPFGIYLGTL